MSFNASSTKERYEELRKNPLVFSKFGPINIQDDMGYNHSTTGFSEGLAAVKVGDKWGYINSRGELKIEPKYKNADSFCNGFAEVELRDEKCLINNAGEIVFKFEKIGSFKNNWACVLSDEKWGYINVDGTIIRPKFDSVEPFLDGFACVKIDGKFGIINTNGEIVFKAEDDDYEGFGNFGNGVFKLVSQATRKYGYFNAETGVFFKPEFDVINMFSGEDSAEIIKNHKYGYIYSGGKNVIMPKYDGIKSKGSNDLVPVQVDKLWGYVNLEDKMEIEPQFECAGGFDDNGLAPVMAGRKWGYINSKGEITIKPQFDNAYSFNENGLAIIRIGVYYGLINTKGDIVLRPQFRDLSRFGNYGYQVMFNDKWGLLDNCGNVVLEPQFDMIKVTPTEDGLVGVSLKGVCGFINLKGEIIYEPQFEDVSKYNDGVALAEYKSRKTPLKKKAPKVKK